METSIDPQIQAITAHLGTVTSLIAALESDLARKKAFAAALAAALADLTKV
jgi:hypothetical protein